MSPVFPVLYFVLFFKTLIIDFIKMNKIFKIQAILKNIKKQITTNLDHAKVNSTNILWPFQTSLLYADIRIEEFMQRLVLWNGINCKCCFIENFIRETEI